MVLRRTLENLLIGYREMNLSQICYDARVHMLQALTNANYFSEHLTAHFEQEPKQLPYVISNNDPQQVAFIKKMINTIYHIEQVGKKLESVPIHDEAGLHSIMGHTALSATEAINDLYKAVQLLDHAPRDLQALFGPYFNTLLPKITGMAGSLQSLSSSASPIQGKLLANLASSLPGSAPDKNAGIEHLGKLLIDLPSHFDQIRRLIAVEPETFQAYSALPPQEYQEKMLKRAKAAKKQLTNLYTQEGLMLLPAYYKTAMLLFSHSIDVIRSASKLTKEAHKAAINQLNEIRHQHLPALIAELEEAEENMGLKSGLLTTPTLDAMNNYYNTLVKQIELTPSMLRSQEPQPHIETMCDSHFIKHVGERQIKRLQATQTMADNTLPLESAIKFFKTINEHNTYWERYYNRRNKLTHLPPETLQKLSRQYQQFQSVFAERYPLLDQIIVDALTPQPPTFLASKGTVYKNLWAENHFIKIMETKDAVLEGLNQSIAQAKLKTTLIQSTMRHHENTYALPERNPARPSLPEPIAGPVKAMGSVLAKNTLFSQIQQLNLSEKMGNFLKETIIPFLNEQLEPEVFEALQLENPQHSYLDAPEVMLYNDLINGIYHIQTGLQKLEGLARDPIRVKFLLELSNGYQDIALGVKKIGGTTQNPAIQHLIQQGIGILKPLKALPLIGEQFNLDSNILPPQPLTEQEMILRWKEQLGVVNQIKNMGNAVSAEVPPPQEDIRAIAQQLQTAHTAEGSPLLQQIATALYQMPHSIRQARITLIQQEEPSAHPKENEKDKHEIQSKIQAFVHGLEKFPLSHSTLKNILGYCNEINNQLHQSAQESRALIYENFNQIYHKLGEEIFNATDELEFQTGFKTNVLSNQIGNTMHDFYTSFIHHLPDLSSQQKFKLMLDSDLSHHRIQKAKEQLEQLQQGEAQLAEEIRLTKKDIDDNFLIDAFMFDPDSSKPEDHQAFLKLYAKMQPLLEKIDPATFDTLYFLRELRTPSNFWYAYNELTSKYNDLVKLLNAPQNHLSQKIERKKQQISRLEHLHELAQHDKEAAINDFKLGLYLDELSHLQETLEQEKMGAYTTSFIEEYIKPDFVAHHQNALKTLPLDKHLNHSIQHQFGQFKANALREHASIYSAYVKLCETDLTLKNQVRELTHPPLKCPLQKEWLAQLRKIIPPGAISFPPAPEELRAEAIHNACKKIQAQQDSLYHYQNAYTIYLKLESVKTHLEKNANPSKLTQDKIACINHMQHILDQTEQPIKSRLHATAQTFQDNQALLAKNADSVLIKLINWLRSKLTGWISPEKQQTSSFISLFDKKTGHRSFNDNAPSIEEDQSLPTNK